ncbi:MAG: glycosyltransferase [Vallitalea sp.]|jgi:glycosyltransferase involved in cell wall biosynthesis|nr:glycosyltransferase [Vallitalea sp.]
MAIPLVCFTTWNRAGLTARNLTALLQTTDDFELYIIDNNSQDDTWEFINQLSDNRIKCKKRFDVNRGIIYALNYVLSKRKKEQFFLYVENDVCILSKDWISRYLKIMNNFKDVGILGYVSPHVINAYSLKNYQMPKLISNKDTSYYQYHIVMGCLWCMRPELIQYVGYWNEETYRGEIDMCMRINKYTSYKIGFDPTILIKHEKKINCEDCILKNNCSLLDKSTTCFKLYKKKYMHNKFSKLMAYKISKYIEEIESKKRTVYCASIHDNDSLKDHYYNKEWAMENFQFFIDNAN